MMTDRPTPQHCRAWLDAYGTHLPDWPPEQRALAIAAFADTDCRAVWDQAVMLDEALDAWQVAPPPATLAARIEASAPQQTRRRLLLPLFAAAAALSGAVVGSVAAAAITPTAHHADDPANTVFGTIDGASE